MSSLGGHIEYGRSRCVLRVGMPRKFGVDGSCRVGEELGSVGGGTNVVAG
jgi:hypothetical protein